MKVRMQTLMELVKVRHKRYIPLFVAIMLLFVSVIVVYASVTEVRIVDGDTVIQVRTLAADPYAILAESGITLAPNDQIDFASGYELIVKRAKTVHFLVDGQMLRVSSCGDTVKDALLDAGIALGPEDEVNLPLEAALENDMEVSVARLTAVTEVRNEIVPYETVTVQTAALYVGESRVKTAGVNGEKELTYRVTSRDGVEIGRELVSEVVTKPAVNRVVERGSKKKATAPAKTQSTSAKAGSSAGTSGTIGNLKYKKVLTCSATAYTVTKGSSGITASGMRAQVGVVAVDPRVIPLGTKLYIASPDGSYVYGTAVAGDTGGAVKGNVVDLFFNTLSECYSFGRRTMNVYILE